VGELVVGANLPWLDYGQDFGACAWQPRGGLAARPERRERLRRALGDLAASGASLVRWWLLGDGRSGLREDGEGRVVGPDDRLFPDVDEAVEGLRQAGLRAQLVLVDFLWLDAPRVVDGARLGGRREHVRDPSLRARLLERVFAPIAERYAREPAIAGGDLMNEPEWATLGVGTLDPRRSVSRREMRAFLAETAAVFHARATQPLSVGLASARWLSLADGLGLDEAQVHWYESLDPVGTLARPVATLGLGRPLLLGEFPTRGATLPPREILAIARGAGYSGALAWSALASDRATDPLACRVALRDWCGRAAPDLRQA
jgi:hypothetical protein